MSSTKTANEQFGEDQRLLDAKKTAKYLGYSVATLHRHHGAGLIPTPLRIGGAVRWDKDELDAWIIRGCPEAEAWGAIKQSDRVNFGR